jgi:UDP-N-acetylglucosamine--N-acetylmuramyl-(pentapeptide) pyrophosphoryl-undecaprenol N-acetylglucosamine transferase
LAGGRALLVAGGTGGHLFPALALREVLIRRGWTAHVATDPRVGELVEGVPPDQLHRIPSATISFGAPLAMASSLFRLGLGVRHSRKLIKLVRPTILVGFGGYPTVPPALAARLARIPMVAHEQNAVVGRANRLLLRFGAVLATGFKHPKGVASTVRSVHVGNPVRKAIIEAVTPYESPSPNMPFRLLVFGGSQGAHVFSKLIPEALALFPDDSRWILNVVQQARAEDVEATRKAFLQLGIESDIMPFFNDMGERIANAHLVVCRAGASTVAELAVIGRPSILVPYPHALDHDQAENARALAQAGGAWVVPQHELTPTVLARRLGELLEDPDELAEAASAAGDEGRVDAAERLADLVEEVANERWAL